MIESASTLVSRLQLLGLKCDDVPRDQVSSPIAALACFPMYMVANVHGWTTDRQFKIPFLEIHGSEAFRESIAIGAQEARMEMSSEHRKVVASMLSPARAPDRVVYEFALESLAVFLSEAQPGVVETIRAAVARMIVAVAKASGEKLFGLGEKISPEERECIFHIAKVLGLAETPKAAEILATVPASAS